MVLPTHPRAPASIRHRSAGDLAPTKAPDRASARYHPCPPSTQAHPCSAQARQPKLPKIESASCAAVWDAEATPILQRAVSVGRDGMCTPASRQGHPDDSSRGEQANVTFRSRRLLQSKLPATNDSSTPCASCFRFLRKGTESATTADQ